MRLQGERSAARPVSACPAVGQPTEQAPAPRQEPAVRGGGPLTSSMRQGFTPGALSVCSLHGADRSGGAFPCVCCPEAGGASQPHSESPAGSGPKGTRSAWSQPEAQGLPLSPLGGHWWTLGATLCWGRVFTEIF